MKLETLLEILSAWKSDGAQFLSFGAEPRGIYIKSDMPENTGSILIPMEMANE